MSKMFYLYIHIFTELENIITHILRYNTLIKNYKRIDI